MTSQSKLTLAYVVAAFIALGAALYSVLGVSWPERGAVAYVNGEPIPQAEYNRVIKAMQAGIERPLTEEDQAKAMRLLVDEELIVQDAERLGLGRQDRLVRKNLVQAMIRSATSLEGSSELEESEARAFFEDNQNLFATPKRLSLQIAKIDSGHTGNVFKDALDKGLSFQDASERAGFAHDILPADIPIGKVSDLIGGSAAELTDKMKSGDIAGPVASGGGEIYIWLTNSKGGPVNFEDARDLVETELRRRKDEAALEAYIKRLRSRARIKTQPSE